MPLRKNFRFFLVAGLLFVLPCTGCLFPPPKPDPARAEMLRAQGDAQAEERDFAAAAATLADAVKFNTADGSLHLRLGELLEMSGKPQQAADAYAAGLAAEGLAADNHWRGELAYRQALVAALKLQKPETARQLLTNLPETDVRYRDLQAVLTLVDKNPRGALTILNDVRKDGLDSNMAARISYHAALAYLLLERTDLATVALYQAINHAGKSLVAWDIEQLWKEINAGSGQHH